ncbi:MAG: phosphatase PAP2 family protein [Rickettsiaceae bacterium]|nr:MAG: phosphatase PAP2 family protein [Rickettsiaceae bacterium]
MFELFYNFYGINQKLFLFINNLTNSKITIAQILYLSSYPFGISKFAIYYVIGVVIAYYRIKNIKSSTNRLARFWQLYQLFTKIGIIYTFFGCTYAALKFSINLPRPFCSLTTETFFTITDTQSYRCLSSFPSAHVGLAVMISYIFWRYTNVIGKACLIILTTTVAISRLSLAVHYPADILYSLIIIILVIICGNKISYLLKNNILFRIGSVISQAVM